VASALGFGLGFQGFADDWRLGLSSGFKPDMIVVDRSYREFTRPFETGEPLILAHVVTTLSVDYRLSARNGTFRIFARARAGKGNRSLASMSAASGCRKRRNTPNFCLSGFPS
jgi:hypothetical protein